MLRGSRERPCLHSSGKVEKVLVTPKNKNNGLLVFYLLSTSICRGTTIAMAVTLSAYVSSFDQENC